MRDKKYKRPLQKYIYISIITNFQLKTIQVKQVKNNEEKLIVSYILQQFT